MSPGGQGCKRRVCKGAVLFVGFLLLSLCTSSVLVNGSTTSEAVVKADVTAQNAGDRATFLSLRTTVPGTPENKDDLALFMELNPDCDPLSNIVRAELLGIKALPYDLAASITIMDKYQSSYDDVIAYYVAISYEVKRETKYVYNGVNYRLYVLGLEQGQWVIVEVSEIPIHRVLEAGYGFGTLEERTALWIQQIRLYTGRFLNPKGEVIESEDCSN